MKLLGKSKVIKHKTKPEITYSLVRPPQSEINLAGETAYVFKIEYNAKSVYLISLEAEFNGKFKVIPPEVKPDLELRFEVLKKKLSNYLESENKNGGLSEIRRLACIDTVLIRRSQVILSVCPVYRFISIF